MKAQEKGNLVTDKLLPHSTRENEIKQKLYMTQFIKFKSKSQCTHYKKALVYIHTNVDYI